MGSLRHRRWKARNRIRRPCREEQGSWRQSGKHEANRPYFQDSERSRGQTVQAAAAAAQPFQTTPIPRLINESYRTLPKTISNQPEICTSATRGKNDGSGNASLHRRRVLPEIAG